MFVPLLENIELDGYAAVDNRLGVSLVMEDGSRQLDTLYFNSHESDRDAILKQL